MRFYRFLACTLTLLLLSLSANLLAQDTAPDSNVTIHVVQRGETLFRIATRYNVTVDELTRLNGLVNPGNIQVGQRLLVPVTGSTAPAALDTRLHIVQPGETLNSIAALYHLQLDDLLRANTIPDTGAVYIGQALVIPGVTHETPVEEAPAVAESDPPTTVSSVVHVVQRGETLFRIANAYGVTVNDLSRANSITDPTLIYPGQQLIIPGYEPAELALDLPAPVTGLDVIPHTLVEGQTVRFRITTSAPVTISGTFLGRVIGMIAENDGTRHTSLQGIPLFTDAGVYPLELLLTERATGQQTSFSVNLQIAAGRYGRETITLLADRGGLLEPAVEEAELNLLQRVMTVISEPRHFEGPMSLPAAATIISPFGTRRSYNGSAFDRFHSGTDFAGAPGTPILAAAPGRVVLADTLNVRGIATVIDHGWGVFTGYWHQSERYVSVGDFVTTGQTIGTIGSTGRVTGAHLHWELWAGGVPVDPMQWVRQSFN